MNPQKNASEQKANLIEAEIQHNIPVKQHTEGSSAPNPINSGVSQANNSAELENVLKDVNKSVKEADKKTGKKKLSLFHKKPKPQETAKPQKTANPKPQKLTKPATIVVAAILVAVSLSIAAVYAFSQTKSSTDNTTAAKINSASGNSVSNGASKINSNDVEKLSSELKSKIDSLNDSQDFNSTDLADQNLGL